MLEAESEIMMTRNPTQQAPGIKDKATNTPAVIAWLLTNYALREGAPSLPKAQVYQEYVAYCGEAGLEPTTPPAFGKILRVAFPSIECRRKGPRGEAKHHYKHFCKKSDLALLVLPSSSTSSSAASVNGHISPSPIPTSKFDVSSGTTHRLITPASSSASVRLPSLRTTSPFQPIMDDVSHQLYPHRYHGDYHDGELVDGVSSGAAAAKKRALDSHGSDPHADLRELLKKKIKSESRGADADPSAQRMRGGHMQQHHGGPDQDNEAELGGSQDQHHKRRRLSQEISNNSNTNGVEYENNSNSNDDDDEEGAVAEYIRQFKSSTESIDRRKSPSPPLPLQRPSSALGGETATRLDPSPPALPSFNSLAIPLRLPPLPQQPPMTHSMLAPSSGASAVHSRLPSPLDFSSLRSASPSPAPSPYGHTRSHTATPPPAQFFAPPAPSSSSVSAGNPPPAPSSSQTALLLSHLQEKEQEVEKLTNELKFLHSRLASTTPIPLPSPSPSPSSSLFPSPHSYSPSPMHHPPSPFAPHAAYMRSSPAPYMAGGHSSSPSPSPSPLHHLHHSFTPLSPPPGASSSHSASPLSHHHPHARQYFAPILTLEEQQQQQQQLHHQRDSTPPMQTTTVTVKRERSSKGRESATRDLMASPGPGVERSSSTSPTHRNRSASPLDADEFSSTSPSSPTFSSKVMKKEAIPVVVHWIKKNYELSADSSSDLPKEQVYRHYREFCEETGVQQTNCATFGKILRSVFPNLKTRRLGSRGNTKHHYHGIRRRKSPLSTESGAQGGTTSPPPNLNALAVLASISVTGGGSPMPSPPGIPPSSSGSPRQQPHAYEDEVDDDDDEDNDNEDDMDEEDIEHEGTNGNDNRNDQPLLQSPVPIRPHAKVAGESEEMINEDEEEQQPVASYGWMAGGSGGDFALSSRRCTVEACENRAAAQRTICEKHKKQQQRARLRNSLDAKISSTATIFSAAPSSSSSSSSLSSSLSSSSSILPPLSALSLSPASDVPPPL